MIEHAAAEELWQRYYRGDQNIFTRRLYTPRGQQTFDFDPKTLPVRACLPQHDRQLQRGV